MNNFLLLLRVLVKRIWWLLSFALVAAIIAFIFLKRVPDQYKSETVIYTGIISGYDAVSMSARSSDLVVINSTIENLLSIIKSQPTLRTVSLKLLAQDLMHLDPDNDNEYLSAESSRKLLESVPVDVLKIVDVNDFDQTVANLRAYADQDRFNYVYGLFHWHDPHYSFEALSEIVAERIGSSDMLDISYINDDPYIVYNTLAFLTEEFIDQYNELRFQQTNKVIEYFRSELETKGNELNRQEIALRDYNRANLVINYDEQTRIIAEREGQLSKLYDDASINYQGALSVRENLEMKLEDIQVFKNNAMFLEKLKNVSAIYSSTAASSIDITGEQQDTTRIRAGIERQKLINEKTEELHKVLENIANQKYTKEGLLSADILEQWFNAMLDEAKAKAELDVLSNSIRELKLQFIRFSPIGTEIKKDTRAISFTERSYLSILEALNEAILRQKNLEMSSATFKVMTPPAIANAAEPKKGLIVILISAFLTMMFVLVVCVIIEIFNRKPRDKWEASKLISKNVLGAYPAGDIEYFELAQKLSVQQMANAIINQFDRTKECNIVNITSANEGVGKTTLMDALYDQLVSIGMKPFKISWNKDFNSESKDFMMSFSIYDFAQNVDDPEALIGADVILVEYPPVSKSNVPDRLIVNAAINLFVVDAKKNWMEMDQLLYRQFENRTKDTPIYVCINNASGDAVGTFTGMLPPFNARHSLSFRLSNLGLDA